ncbi:MAG: hypothetical protein Q7T55_12330 [Solirubrobacteraceae bacterium]|nr:hypothetical protein [Solirubrobacteraceae bacterium]
MFRPAPVHLSTAPRRRLPALTALLGALLVFAAPAQAAKISFSATDPKGDGKSTAGLDIVKAEGSYDNATGVFKVTTTTAAPFTSAQGLLTVIIGTAQNGVCNYSDPGVEGLPPFLQFYLINIEGTPTPPVYSYSTKDISGSPAMTKSGNATTFVTPADPQLANLPLDCLYAATAYDTPSGGAIADDVFSLAVADPGTGGSDGSGDGGSTGGGGSGGGSGSGSTAPLKIVTTDPDADKDGVADSADKCAKVPGALANGCPVMKTADEFRLGAKRIVVDKLVAMTAKTCPPRVRITVTSKGKKLGTGVFTVDQHGSFCRVKGIVKLKKKKKAVRVVTKGTGMQSIAKSVRR